MVVDVARCRAQKLKPSLAEERPATAHLSHWQEDDARTPAPVSRPCPGYPLLDRCVQMRAEEPKTINGGHGGHALDELLSSTSTVLTAGASWLGGPPCALVPVSAGLHFPLGLRPQDLAASGHKFTETHRRTLGCHRGPSHSLSALQAPPQWREGRK